MIDVVVVAAVVAVAELGDKTQLLGVAAAARHPPHRVLAAMLVGYGAVNVVSVAVGDAVGRVVPETVALAAAGTIFCALAVWTGRDSGASDPGSSPGAAPGRRSSVALAGAFFVSELGDKTQLTAGGFAASRPALAVWVGATIGLVAAGALAVVAGRRLADRFAPQRVQRWSAVAMGLVGLALIGWSVVLVVV